MSQNLEIEFKNILNKEEYQKLMLFFQIPETDIFSQENHYFDTADFLLKQKGTALRIREKGNEYEMTLKQPAKEGLLETNQSISASEASLAINNSCLPEGIIKDLLVKIKVPYAKLRYFGSLLTKRAEIHYKSGLLVLDHSYYLNQEDFELEYEVENYLDGQEVFHQLLREQSIPKRKTTNKIERFYLQKSKLNYGSQMKPTGEL